MIMEKSQVNFNIFNFLSIQCANFSFYRKTKFFAKFYEYPYITKQSKKILINVDETIHSLTLNNTIDNDIYEEYLKYNNEFSHSYQNFINLNNCFNEELLLTNPILVKVYKNKFIIIDGLHRFICYLNSNPNIRTIPKDYIKIVGGNISSSSSIDLAIYSKKIIRKARFQIRRIFYNGWKKNEKFIIGYHSLNVFNLNLAGQRDCRKRISEIEELINLNDLNIIDLGCNSGGLLWHINQPGQVVGIDFDYNCINLAKYIKYLISKQNLEFSNRFNFFKCDLNNINKVNSIVSKLHLKFDLVILTSMGSWVKNLEDLILFSSKQAKYLVYESNNPQEFEKQKLILNKYYVNCKEINYKSMDDLSGNYSRQSFLYFN